ncbi:MAG: sensor histidine kinase, partial [Planctomycetota bacterium]
AGRTDETIDILIEKLTGDRFVDTRDELGRLIVPNAQLHALHLIDHSQPEYQEILQRLVKRVNDYTDAALPANQRRFLMNQLSSMIADKTLLPTLAAENLAIAYLETNPAFPQPGRLVPALKDIWQVASPKKNIVALFKHQAIVKQLQSLSPTITSAKDVSIRMLSPSEFSESIKSFIAIPAGGILPDWRLALYLEGENPFAAAADKQIAVYLWTGILVILTIIILVLLVARYLSRQMKLTRLKNDLIATVSHELKTPLSSIRVLVDTLLANEKVDSRQTEEYLGLIAKENIRLSRLIDNFLTFSRMERKKYVFDLTEIMPEDIVNEAREAVSERFESAGCKFEVEVAAGLPSVRGDGDALTTAVLNLLDNAFKYTESQKHITLRAYQDNGFVCLEVKDNGIGLSRRAVKKIFNRFYQVDRSLTRRGSGCGLGLSIVQFIVQAHRGSIEVKSRPKEGSTFTIKLPLADR